MDLSLAQLRLLLAVEEWGSFTDAASAVGQAQSSVSRQVAAAERHFGVRIFQRTRHGAAVTPAGRPVLRRVAAALQQLEAEPVAPALRSVRLGVFPYGGSTLLPEAIQQLQQAPFRLETHESYTPRLVRMLRAGELDLAIVSSRAPHRAVDALTPPLRMEPLLDVDLAVGVATDGPLGDRSDLTAAELAALDWIGTPEPGRGGYGLGVWPGLPGQPPIRYATADWGARLELIAAGAGVGIVPIYPRYPMRPDVTLLRVADLPVERRRVDVVFAESATDSRFELVLHALRWAVH